MPFVTLLADYLASATRTALRLACPRLFTMEGIVERQDSGSGPIDCQFTGAVTRLVTCRPYPPFRPASAPVCRSCSTSRSTTSVIARTPLVHSVQHEDPGGRSMLHATGAADC